jgi:hypothetical protein
MIVDSSLTLEEALFQKYEIVPPKEILKEQRIIEVEYFSFDRELHRGQIVINAKLVNEIKEVFNLIKEIKFPIQSAIPIGDLRFLNDDDKSIYANNTSAFNYRFIARTKKISNHSYGKAIDINPLINPYFKGDYIFPPDGQYIPGNPGVIVKDDPIYSLFTRLGWEWGGNWSDRKDYQHFEKPQ